MSVKNKITVLASTMTLLGVLTLPAHATLYAPKKEETISASPMPVNDSQRATVSLKQEPLIPEITYEKPEIKTEPAPVPDPEPIPEPEPVVLPESAPIYTPEPEPVAVIPKPAAPEPVAAPAAKSAVASAALGQIGVMQDCTMLVTNSLRAVGINFHGWPHEYFSLGHQVSAAEAQPGDLIYYLNGSGPGSLAHIAVYIGNGQAVHGGWNGNQTIVYSVNVGSGPVFIRLK